MKFQYLFNNFAQRLNPVFFLIPIFIEKYFINQIRKTYLD